MQNLNNDCLLEIFQYLTLKDQLILTKVCGDFRALIVDLMWKRKFRHLHMHEHNAVKTLTDEEFEELFVLIVKYVEEFTLITARKPQMSFRSVEAESWWPELLFYFNFSYPRLKYFKCMHPRLHDGNISTVAPKCEQLQILHLGSSHITGKHMLNFKNLRELIVPGCSLSIEHLTEIMLHLNLTHLNLTANKFDMNELPAMVIERMLCLQQLTLDEKHVTSNFVEAMQNCCSLNSLHINNYLRKPALNENWLDFHETCGGNIKTLKILEPVITIISFTLITNLTTTYFSYLKNLQNLCINNTIRNTKAAFASFKLQLEDREFELLYDLLDLIESCTKLQHIYLTATSVCNPKFQLWLNALIERLNTFAAASRETLTIHLLQNDLTDGHGRILRIEDITQSDIYKRQNIVKLEIDDDSTDGLRNHQANVEFGFFTNKIM